MKHFITLILLLTGISAIAQQRGLVYPKNDQVLQDTSISLQWDESPNDTAYYITLATDSLFQNKILDAHLSPLTSRLSQLNSNTTYYWFINYQPTNHTTDTFQFTIFNPKDIDSLILWLAADSLVTYDSLNRVSQWGDLSGKGHDASQLDTLLQPIFSNYEIGNLPSISFLNGNYIISGDYFNLKPSNKNRSLFLLLDNKYLSGYNNAFVNYNQGIISYFFLETSFYTYMIRYWVGDGSSYSLENLFGNFSDVKLSSLVTNNSNIDIYSNNNIVITKSLSKSCDSINSFAIGGRTSNGTNISQPFNGQVFEIIDYAKPLSSFEITLVNKYLLHKYTPPLNLGPNILRRYSFCDTTLRTTKMYESYQWSTGDTTREITIAKEDTGWYWCEVPNLFGDIMRDSVYVYNLLPQQDFQDRTICYGDSLLQSNSFLNQSEFSSHYSFLWQDANTSDTLSSSPILQLSNSQLRTLVPSYPHTLVLSIKDTLGCFITDTLIIKIDSFPIQASLGPNKSLCTGDKLSLQTEANKTTLWQWNTGSQDSLITIDTAGIYSLQVTDTNGCIAKDTINISIKGITPIVGYIADTVCRTDSTLFIDTSFTLDASSITQWIWEFGDTSSPSLQLAPSPRSHLYSDSGTYTTKLTVTTDSGCTNYAYKNIYIRPLPQPNFSPLTGCQNLNIQFNNNTLSPGGNIANNLWIVNSQDSLLVSSPTHSFANSGNQNIKLITTDIHGCKDSITKQIYIKPSPQANFQYTTACEGERIYFNDSSKLPLSNQILEQKWWFNNNIDSSIAATPSYQFDSAAYWPVKYYVKGLNGCWDTITKNVTLHPFIKADFTNGELCLNNEESFYGTQVYHTNLPSYVDKYLWKADTNIISNQLNAQHTFNDTLEHTVMFYIKTTAGCEDSIKKTLKVHPLPKADFTTNRSYGLPPLEIEFNNTSLYASNYYWGFGDGQSSTEENPIHIYQDSTIYNVNLEAVNTYGCTDTANGKIFAIYAMIDIAIQDIKAEINDDYVSFSLKVINQGLRPVNKIEFEAGINNTLSIKEIWQGSLAPGKSLNYNFVGQTKVENIEELKFYCAKATPITIDKQQDERKENNSLCIEANEKQWVGSPYPNPATESLSLDYILDVNKKIEMAIFNNKGDKIQRKTYQGKRGLNRIILPVQNLSPGIYYLRITIEDEIIKRRFVVQ